MEVLFRASRGVEEPAQWIDMVQCKRVTGHNVDWDADGGVLAKVIWVGVFQYCVMRVLMTIVAVATQATGTYCEESLSPAFAHVWVRLLLSLALVSSD